VPLAGLNPAVPELEARPHEGGRHDAAKRRRFLNLVQSAAP